MSPDSDAIRSAAADAVAAPLGPLLTDAAGITGHVCPRLSCYRSTRLLAGDNRFVLSTSGHVAAMQRAGNVSP